MVENNSPDEAGDEPFGPECPVCKKSDGMVNIGPNHWFHCQAHKLAWCIGANVFSSWKWESPSDWRESLNTLIGCRLVGSAGMPGEVFTAAEADELFAEMVEKRRDRAWVTAHNAMQEVESLNRERFEVVNVVSENSGGIVHGVAVSEENVRLAEQLIESHWFLNHCSKAQLGLIVQLAKGK